MTPTCYACLIVGTNQRLEPRNTPVQQDDPRLLVGEFGASTVYDRYAAEQNFGFKDPTGMGDYQLRAMVGMSNPGKHINAPQLLEAYDRLLGQLFSPGQFQDTHTMYDALFQQGGYYPLPIDATLDDQIFAVYVGLYAFELQFPPEVFQGALLGQFTSLAEEWLAYTAQGGNQTLIEYLRPAGMDDWH